MPTPLCRDQTIRELALHPSKSTWLAEPRVRCWADLWRWVASIVRKGPTLLSDSAATAVLDEALRDETAGGRRGPLAELTSRVGYRRRLRRRVRDWTVAERHRERDDERPEPEDDGDDAIRAAEVSVFRRYRRLLTDLDAEDEAGLSVWASLRLRDRNARAGSGEGDHLVFLDFEGKSPAQWRILRDILERPRSVDVTLCHQDAPERAELYLATAPIRARLLDLGMVESLVPSDSHRPAGLRAVDALLFAASAPKIETGEGLSIRGGPAGMDLGRMVAREVKDLIGRGVEPDEILIAFPRWDDQAESACLALRRAGLPVHDAGPRTLDVDPSVAATLQAARIPVEEWEAEQLVRFLRNGQLQPSWGEDVDRLALAEAASTLHESSVFRGDRQILQALERAIARNEDAPDPIERDRRRRKVERARRAHPIIKRVIDVLAPLDRPRPWSEHAIELRRAATELGLGSRDGRALETLWDALEDRAEILERLGRDAVVVPWAEFVDVLTDVTAEVQAPRPTAPDGSIRTTLVDDLGGCRAGRVLLVGLVEGSFPRRPAVERFLELKPGEEPSPAGRAAYAAETLRFLRALGAAERGAHLFYPTTDAKGQPLLRAGFLDDLLGAMSAPAESACHVAHARFHPALLDREDLAVAPGDARVLAAALAAERGRTARLRDLAADPGHRAPLEGAAAALQALDRRRRGAPFGEFEGLLTDPEAHSRLARDFDGLTHTFSPSQLETYLNCPFQFFSRHVLHLDPIAERDELDEDATERGSRLHDILEEFERRRAETDADTPDERLLAAAVDKVLAKELDELSELDLGLREIELGQVQRITAQYAQQRAEYTSQTPTAPAPRMFEFGFGEPGTDHPEFELTLGAEVVRLKGRIDRIDMVDAGAESGPPRYRIIDYKSGNPPSSKDVTEGRMLQLPLYAMAVERLLYQRGEAELLDVGYWGLKDKGYRPIVFAQWQDVREALIERVFAIIHRLRDGAFQVAPRKEGCEAYCEYRGVCRIRQVRAAGKTIEPDAQPTASADKTLGGRPARASKSAKSTEPKAERS
ncbi:ATP-dependent helicase/deoxyribonuclease subunit B [Planctomyces sp. SH-PL62]|nr:ATP-dependent helicase/deoxyribonuclease subunit B [Planctomyces sp. SH-PL62]